MSGLADLSFGYDVISVFALFWWCAARMIGWLIAPLTSLCVGVVVACLFVFVPNPVMPVAVAVLAPVGVGVAALAVRDLMARNGIAVQRFGTVELAVFLGTYICFLAAALGVVEVDLYRLGYGPHTGSVVLFVFAALAIWRRQYILLIGIFLGQIFWAFSYGSTNAFDHVLHVALVPVATVVLLRRLAGRAIVAAKSRRG